MTIAEYQTLTGTTVSQTDTARVTAIIRRAESKLGTLLGYPLSKQKTWTELGKVQYDGLVPFPSLPIGDDVLNNLSAPDNQTGEIQLFNLDELDKHIRINPAKEVYRAKIVLPVNRDEFITIYDLDTALPYLNSAGLVAAITRHTTWYAWTGWSSLLYSDRKNLMIAVDADYVDVCDASKYEDLAYLLADMVTYYSNPNYSIMGNVRSESIDSHSYSRDTTGSTPDSSAPEGQASSKMIIEKYAGPGVFRKLVR
ncbi:MAG: hypothetical protein WCJ60_03470 [bacterium]